MITITANRSWIPTEWALLERKLFTILDEAAVEFVNRYVNEDDTLLWRRDWPGMDGSDDPYEGFMNLALLYVLGGRDELKSISRNIWEGITWQFTQYGQLHREFDGYYDWMHHGEGYLYFYFLGLVEPDSLKNNQRAVNFARMYTGEDKEASNYDAARHLIRSPITGSRGPRHQTTGEDWCTHRGILDNYQAPFEDIPGVDFASGKCPWSDDQVYANIIQKFNERMAKGDVPLNLNATGLITNAFLYTGNPAYKKWVLDYVEAWSDRARKNGGLIPDNVGLTGAIGEYNDGKWWGGYYGWRWPHGYMTIIEPIVNGVMNAVLLSGDTSYLDLARSQMDRIWELGKEQEGKWVVPHKHFDQGWTDYRSPNPNYPIYLWTVSMDQADYSRVERIQMPSFYTDIEVPMYSGGNPVTKKETKHYIANTVPWFHYMQDNSESRNYPERILQANIALVQRQLAKMRSEEGDPHGWITDDFNEGSLSSIHKWQEMCPVYFEGLLQLTLGAPMHISHGGLQHARVRYYDAQKQRPGLPPDVAALVERITNHETVITLIHTGLDESREVVIQAGSFGEHTFTHATWSDQNGEEIGSCEVGDKWLQIKLEPGLGLQLKLRTVRYANSPSYATPWSKPVSLIQGRTQ